LFRIIYAQFFLLGSASIIIIHHQRCMSIHPVLALTQISSQAWLGRFARKYLHLGQKGKGIYLNQAIDKS